MLDSEFESDSLCSIQALIKTRYVQEYLLLPIESQTINKCPIEKIETHEHTREKNARTLVDPSGNFLGGHGGPRMRFRGFIRAIAAGACRDTACLVVEALSSDSRQVECRWETLEANRYII